MIPIVSIFIPVYNGEKYLAETLNSLLLQSFSNYEIIIVDDGSVDKTSIIARKYVELDSRIKLVTHDKNYGLSAARNTGWRSSNPLSKYLMNHDSDDISLPYKLETLITFLEENPDIAAVGSFAEYFDNTGNIVGRPPIEWKPKRIRATFGKVNSMLISATLMRRKLIETVAPFREQYRGCDDYDFWARALISGFNLANIPQVLHKIRIHGESVSAKHRKDMEVLSRQIQKMYSAQRRKNLISSFINTIIRHQ